MLVAGVDEAGRGPVLGPMVFSVVVLDEKDQKKLSSWGVTDSKLLAKDVREELFDKITSLAKEYKILALQPQEINEWMKSASLNDIEAIKTAEMINSLESSPEVIYIDCPDVRPKRYEQNINNLCEKNSLLVAEHKADMRYKSSAAASILAKVTRDKAIDDLAKVHGNIGCGYCHDVNTQKWIDDYWDKNRSFPDFVRKRWITIQRKTQLRLTEWD
jgi:ribonuclease HII